MKVTTKGQVTIPQYIRMRAGIVPGSEVEFYEEDGVVYLKKTNAAGRGEALIKLLTGAAQTGMTTEEIMALTRGDG